MPCRLSYSYPQGGDTNFSPLILPNGSIVAMWRHWGGGNGGSRQFLATASDWRDPSTYVQHQTELFPDLGAAGTEDQFVYMDEDGNYHAVFHHSKPKQSSDQSVVTNAATPPRHHTASFAAKLTLLAMRTYSVRHRHKDPVVAGRYRRPCIQQRRLVLDVHWCRLGQCDKPL
jgi:hypothetical protein